MLSAERALYHAAVHLTWPNATTDDDEYLSCFISELLLGEHEAPVGDKHLPRYASATTQILPHHPRCAELSAFAPSSLVRVYRHSMHLTEVGGALRQRSDADARLACIFPKGQGAKARRPRLSEFLGKDEFKPFFRVQDSKIRQSEKVWALRHFSHDFLRLFVPKTKWPRDFPLRARGPDSVWLYRSSLFELMSSSVH